MPKYKLLLNRDFERGRVNFRGGSSPAFIVGGCVSLDPEITECLLNQNSKCGTVDAVTAFPVCCLPCPASIES